MLPQVIGPKINTVALLRRLTAYASQLRHSCMGHMSATNWLVAVHGKWTGGHIFCDKLICYWRVHLGNTAVQVTQWDSQNWGQQSKFMYSQKKRKYLKLCCGAPKLLRSSLFIHKSAKNTFRYSSQWSVDGGGQYCQDIAHVGRIVRVGQPKLSWIFVNYTQSSP
jgi:hypothetical protein